MLQVLLFDLDNSSGLQDLSTTVAKILAGLRAQRTWEMLSVISIKNVKF